MVFENVLSIPMHVPLGVAIAHLFGGNPHPRNRAPS
jgi:hypothetical protein